jgi:hypothetical protein
LAKVHLQHLLTAAALNFVRIGLWHIGIPEPQTLLTLRPAHDSGCLTFTATFLSFASSIRSGQEPQLNWR